MSPPAELVEQVVRMGHFHADMWATGHASEARTMADYVHGVVGTTIRHLLEVGLLQVADDAPAVLAAGVAVGPVPSSWPV